MLDPDDIHLQYFVLQPNGPIMIRPLHVDVMKEYIDTIIAEFRSWKGNPFKIELCIQIAHILICLNREEEAKEYVQYFKDSGVSERQMASLVRNDIAAMEVELGLKAGR